jgi:hypothetical protein
LALSKGYIYIRLNKEGDKLMERTKKGILQEVKYVVDEDGTIQSSMMVSFTLEELLEIPIPNNDFSLIGKFVDFYNIGIPKNQTKIIYIDFKRQFLIAFYPYIENPVYLETLTKGFDEGVAKDLNTIASYLRQNCHLGNIDYSLNSNWDYENKIIPNSGKEFGTLMGFSFVEIDVEAEVSSAYGEKNFWHKLMENQINIDKDRQTLYEIDVMWNYQDAVYQTLCRVFYKKFNVKASNFIEMKTLEDKSLDYLLEDTHFGRVDDNTIIHLQGNNENNIEIILPLKNKDMLVGLKNKYMDGAAGHYDPIYDDVDELFRMHSFQETSKNSISLLKRIEDLDNLYNKARDLNIQKESLLDKFFNNEAFMDDNDTPFGN